MTRLTRFLATGLTRFLDAGLDAGLTRFLTGLALLCAAPALAQPVMLDAKEGQLKYTLVHKLHEVSGVCKTVEGKAALTPDGGAKVQVRAKVACFDSGNSNRDVHMREVTREALYPLVSVKGTLAGLKLPLAAPLQTTLAATVEFNGNKQPVQVPVTLTSEGAKLRAVFKFDISLDAFQVERPELLLVKVDDKLVIEGELTFEPGEAAAAPAAK